MKLITKDDVVKNIPILWRKHYGYSKFGGSVKDKKYEQLIAEGKALTEKKAIEITGVNFGRLVCNECNSDVTDVVQLGGDPAYTEAPANICRGCLIKALHLIEFSEEKSK